MAACVYRLIGCHLQNLRVKFYKEGDWISEMKLAKGRYWNKWDYSLRLTISHRMLFAESWNGYWKGEAWKRKEGLLTLQALVLISKSYVAVLANSFN